MQWSPDGSQLAFVSTSRDHKQANLRVADAAPARPRRPDEKVATFFESGNGRVNWRYLPASNEVIWFSQRDNWGQLYLSRPADRRLKHQITTGEGNVTQVLRVDEKAAHLYFLGVGKEGRAIRTSATSTASSMDGRARQLLTPEDADPRHHAVAVRRRSSSTPTRSPTCRRRRCCATRPARSSAAREGGHLAARRHGLEAADADHREGARRRRPTSTA